ncbi:hypothetical protein DMENIID0001_011770 [Sergentomyia squamirostris]
MNVDTVDTVDTFCRISEASNKDSGASDGNIEVPVDRTTSIVYLRRMHFERLCWESRDSNVPLRFRPHTTSHIPIILINQFPRRSVSFHDDRENGCEARCDAQCEETEELVEIRQKDLHSHFEQQPDNVLSMQCDRNSCLNENLDVDLQSDQTVFEVKNKQFSESADDKESTDSSSEPECGNDAIRLDVKIPENSRPVSEESITTQLEFLIDELLKTEKSYISSLRLGMETYTNVLNNEDNSEVPQTVRGKADDIFKNLQMIYDFHQTVVLPELITCSCDIAQISQFFLKSISEDQFYCHIAYALNYSTTEKICDDHWEFFTRCEEENRNCMDIVSLLLQPMQRIARYTLLFDNILREMAKHLEDTPEIKFQVGAVSKALTAVSKLTQCINASLNVSKIVHCNEINLSHLGKFRDFDDFDLYDKEHKRRYKGHLFLFDKCLVYTENKQTADKPTFLYRGHYSLLKIGLKPSTKRGKLTIYKGRLGHQQFDIRGPSVKISKWKKALNKLPSDFDEDLVDERNGQLTEDDFHSEQSVLGENSSEVLDKELPLSQQFISKQLVYLVNELIDTEENYVSNLKIGIESYSKILDHRENPEVPPSLRGQTNAILGNLKSIYIFHQDTLLPQLKSSIDDIEKLAGVFLNLVSRDSFYCHIIYAMKHPKAKKICDDHIEFLVKCKELIGDRLGIQSLLLQPIQRLPRYVLLLESILKEEAKHFEENPDIKIQFAAVVRALKAATGLANRVNVSMNVNDIDDCYEINLFRQGKFRDFDHFVLFESNTLQSQSFKGHLFLFDKCLVYTENKQTEENPAFLYRGHYKLDNLGMMPDGNNGKLSIFRSRLGQQQLDIKGHLPVISKWEDYLTAIIRRAEAKLEQKRDAVQEPKRLGPSTDLNSEATSVINYIPESTESELICDEREEARESCQSTSSNAETLAETVNFALNFTTENHPDTKEVYCGVQEQLEESRTELHQHVDPEPDTELISNNIESIEG